MSSFYDLASLVMIPSGKKAGKVYSQKPLTTDGQLDFTRASTATRIGSDGNIEKTRTNLLLQSNQFNTTWTIVNSAVLTSGQADKDGGTDAWLIASNGTANAHISQSVTAGVATLSVYAKAGTLNWLRLYVDISGANASAWFDLANGALGTSFNSIEHKIESIGSGWYRCSLIVPNGGTIVRINPSVADIDVSQTTGNIYIQDAQLEQGLVATNYIETTTAAVSVGSVDNMPRLNYTPGSATSCPSLLLEPQRTNLVQYSEYGPEWLNTQSTTTLSTTISSPSGENAVYKATDNTSSSQHRIDVRETVTTGTEYAFSAFVKQESNSDVDFAYLLFSSKFTATRYFFNIKNGTVGNGNGTIENYGNGWYKITGSATANSTGNAVFGVNLADVNGQPTYTGTGNGAMFVWGLQVEEGSYATSYIPTFGATVTRVADVCENGGSSATFNDSEGVIFIESSAFAADSTNKVMTISDGTTANRVQIYYDSSNNVIGSVAGQAVISHTTDITQNLNIAFKYKLNDFALWINGVEVGTDNLGTVPSGLQELSFDNGAGGSNLYGNIKKLIYIPTALNDTQLAELTSIES